MADPILDNSKTWSNLLASKWRRDYMNSLLFAEQREVDALCKKFRERKHGEGNTNLKNQVKTILAHSRGDANWKAAHCFCISCINREGPLDTWANYEILYDRRENRDVLEKSDDVGPLLAGTSAQDIKAIEENPLQAAVNWDAKYYGGWLVQWEGAADGHMVRHDRPEWWINVLRSDDGGEYFKLPLSDYQTAARVNGLLLFYREPTEKVDAWHGGIIAKEYTDVPWFEVHGDPRWPSADADLGRIMKQFPGTTPDDVRFVPEPSEDASTEPVIIVPIHALLPMKEFFEKINWILERRAS